MADWGWAYAAQGLGAGLQGLLKGYQLGKEFEQQAREEKRQQEALDIQKQQAQAALETARASYGAKYGIPMPGLSSLTTAAPEAPEAADNASTPSVRELPTPIWNAFRREKEAAEAELELKKAQTEHLRAPTGGQTPIPLAQAQSIATPINAGPDISTGISRQLQSIAGEKGQVQQWVVENMLKTAEHRISEAEKASRPVAPTGEQAPVPLARAILEAIPPGADPEINREITGRLTQIAAGNQGNVPQGVINRFLIAGGQALNRETREDRTWLNASAKVNPYGSIRSSLTTWAAQMNIRAQRAIDILKADLAANTVLPAHISAAATDIAGLFQGGAPLDRQVEEQNYSTLKGKIANAKTFLTGRPQPAELQGIARQLISDLEHLKQVDNRLVRDAVATHGAVLGPMFPDRWPALRDVILSQFPETGAGVQASSQPTPAPAAAKKVWKQSGIENGVPVTRWSYDEGKTWGKKR